MCRPSKIDSRCVDLRTSMVDVKLGCILAQNIDTIAVCELRRGFALQCFHYISKRYSKNIRDRSKNRDHSNIIIKLYP